MSTGLSASRFQSFTNWYNQYYPFIAKNMGLGYQSRKPFFVDGENGSNRRDGLSPSSALAGFTGADGVTARLQAGDTVIVFPGTYAENVVIDVDYVSLIAAQINGYGRPDIIPATGKALYNQAAQGMYCYGIRFANDGADSDVVLIEGNGYELDNCVFDGGSAVGAANGLIRFKGNATDDSYTASEGKITNSLLRGNSVGIAVIFDTAEPAVGVGETDVTLQGNKFIGNALDIATADTGPGTYSIQRGLIFQNNFATKNLGTYIDLTTSNGGAAGDQTGAINGNWFNMDTVTTTRIKMQGTGFSGAGNFSTVGVADFSALD